MTMSDDAKAPANSPAPASWTVTGVQTVTADEGRSRVDVAVRGTATGAVDRGSGSDQLRFSVWDDGQEKDFKVVDIPLGRTGVVTVRLGFEGRYLTVADGIGITITAGSEVGGERVFDLDPFFPAQG
jgi:hypothetical protein